MSKKVDPIVALALHRAQVAYWLDRFVGDLIFRGPRHDLSKFELEEYSAFTSVEKAEFGTPEYDKGLDMLGEGLCKHYENNRHHPEHFPNGVADMNIVDFTEMIADWLAASGGKEPNFDYLQNRFNISDQLLSIIKNTFRDFPGSKK